MIRLYVIDDHYLIVEGLYSSFDLESDDFEVVGGSLNIPDALERINPEQVDIILLDLFINQSDPISNVDLLSKAFPKTPIVILSQESSLAWQVEMFKRGIRSYLSKGDDKSTMILSLSRVSQGEVVMPKAVMEILIKGNYPNHSFVCTLEAKEILSLLFKGYLPKEIAYNMGQTESTIDKKLKKIREFYDVRNNYALILKLLVKQPAEIDRLIHR
jgi:DNA-binding NarL/FixJ family response regulator